MTAAMLLPSWRTRWRRILDRLRERWRVVAPGPALWGEQNRTVCCDRGERCPCYRRGYQLGYDLAAAENRSTIA